MDPLLEEAVPARTGITSVRIQNFKAHRDTTVPLGRLTVLVGPNGSGKTSVLEALRGLATCIAAAPQPVLLGDQQWADVHHRGSSEPSRITATGASQGTPWELSNGPNEPAPQATYDGQSANGVTMKAAFGTTVLHQFDALKIAAGAVPEASLAQVGADGANTAAVLSTLKLGDDARFERIQAALQRVVPSLERIRVRRVNGAPSSSVREKIHFDLRGAPDLPAQVMSEGTLVTLALLTSICATSGRHLVLLDDIDHALHPTAQLELVRQMKRLLEEMPDVQIVATTHSPFILDEVDPADVSVFALRADGSVATKRLSEHPDADRVKGALSGGQIWTLDPEEKWVVGESA